MKFYNYDENIIKEYENNTKKAVVIHILDKNNNILLQKRGKNASDEYDLYEDVGGKVEEYDIDYLSAIKREIKEEMGDIKIHDIHPVGIFYCPKDVNWLFIVFIGRYIDGEIKIMEKDKCKGYKFFTYEEAINSNELSESCIFLNKSLRENKII